MNSQGSRRLLTFRLDQEQRQRLRARLAREGRTMSEVVTHGLRQYVQHARHRNDPETTGTLVLPDRIAARLRELRSSGRSDLLSATLAALNEAGWPLRPLAEALGIQPAGGAGTRPSPGSGRPPRIRGDLRAAAAVPATAGGQHGRPAAASDHKDRPHAARVRAPGGG